MNATTSTQVPEPTAASGEEDVETAHEGSSARPAGAPDAGPGRTASAADPSPDARSAASPSSAARAAQPAPPKGLLGRLLGLPRYLFRAHLGFLMGHRFLVLVSQGRKSGLRRETPLEVVRYDKVRREAIVAAGWGRKTQWLHNVEAGLAREIWIGRERYVPTYRILDVDEAMETLRHYERHSGIPKQIVRRVLGWLLGWTYDGSAAARRRAAEQLPLIAFRPA